MASDDERSGPFAKRARLTLTFSGPPLRLPDESPPSTELAIEPVDPADLPLPTIEAAPVEEEHDAWTRERVARGSRPSSRPRATPLPFGVPTSAPVAPAIPRDLGIDEPTSDHAGEALSLVERSRPALAGVDLTADMHDRFALDDFTGALQAAELLLGQRPGDAEALRIAATSRDRLIQIYTARIGSLRDVPTVSVPDRDVRWLGLDHRAGFLLSQIDGTSSVDELIDVSGMMRLEALKTLVELIDAGAVKMAK